MKKRIGISARTRFEIFKRDGFTCGYCGQKPPAVILHVDHILAVAQGGGNDHSNLITSCFDCNIGKSDKLLTVRTESLCDVEKKERERFKQLKAYNQWLAEKHAQDAAWLEEVSTVWLGLMGANRDEYSLSPHVELAIRNFLQRLPAEEIIDALYISASRVSDIETDRFFKFWCGVCWRKAKGPIS